MNRDSGVYTSPFFDADELKKWLNGPENFSGLLRSGPLASSLCCAFGELLRVTRQNILRCCREGLCWTAIASIHVAVRTRNTLSNLYDNRPHRRTKKNGNYTHKLSLIILFGEDGTGSTAFRLVKFKVG